ncbi:MAG: AraC family transcriptional regulator [Caulobacteraceae bacterium]
MQRDPDAHEDVDRPVVGVGNDYPPSFKLALHTHGRGQLLHAARGVVAVSTPDGAWVAPPERAVWIPAGVPHAVRMVGTVSTRSVMILPEAAPGLGRRCRVLGVSPLLGLLLEQAAELPVEYDQVGRDGLVMRLLVAEIEQAPLVPLAVPFPTHRVLAARCHAFLEQPDARSTINTWAEALAMNRRSFTRLFRRETGMSFAEWRQQACLAVALPRLAAGDPVTTIALDLGYDSPTSFSNMFKRVVGTTPSRHR